MGYSCELKANKKIKVDDVESVLKTLPSYLSNPFGNSRQDWGWSCGCDVFEPINNKLTIGGSYGVSGDIAQDFVKHVKRGLNNKGYIITTSWDE